MTEKIEVRCEHCAFWAKSPRKTVMSQGECRAEPPRCLVSQEVVRVYVGWPTTSVNDWCGAFTPRGEAFDVEETTEAARGH